jgi:hypothetical protein
MTRAATHSMTSTGTHRQIRKATLERDNCRRLLAAVEKHGRGTPTALQRAEYLHKAEAALWRARSDLCRHDPTRWRMYLHYAVLEERRADLASARLRQARDPEAWGVAALLQQVRSHLAEQEQEVRAYHAWFYRDRMGQTPPDAPCYRHRDGSLLCPPCAHVAYGVDLGALAVLTELPVLAQGQCHLCGTVLME